MVEHDRLLEPDSVAGLVVEGDPVGMERLVFDADVLKKQRGAELVNAGGMRRGTQRGWTDQSTGFPLR